MLMDIKFVEQLTQEAIDRVAVTGIRDLRLRANFGCQFIEERKVGGFALGRASANEEDELAGLMRFDEFNREFDVVGYPNLVSDPPTIDAWRKSR
jgi:hypothetical protein